MGTRTCELCTSPLSIHNKGLADICHSCRTSTKPRTVWVRLMKDGEVHFSVYEDLADERETPRQVIPSEMQTRQVASIIELKALLFKHDEEISTDPSHVELLYLDVIPTLVAKAFAK